MSVEHVQSNGAPASTAQSRGAPSSGTQSRSAHSRSLRSRTERRLRTERTIVTAAGNLFLEHGFKATTIRAIAKRAEVSVGRVMGAGDKDGLLIKCFDRWIEELQSGKPAPRAKKRGAATLPQRITPIAEAPGTGTASAVQHHLLGLFLPFLEFFAAHEDLSRDYAAALMRVQGEPGVFDALATDLQETLAENLVSIGLGREYAEASSAVLYDSYLGVLFRWAASDMSADEAVAALTRIIAFHTRFRSHP